MLPGEGRSLVGDPGSSPRLQSGPGALGRRRWPRGGAASSWSAMAIG